MPPIETYVVSTREHDSMKSFSEVAEEITEVHNRIKMASGNLLAQCVIDDPYRSSNFLGGQAILITADMPDEAPVPEYGSYEAGHASDSPDTRAE